MSKLYTLLIICFLSLSTFQVNANGIIGDEKKTRIQLVGQSNSKLLQNIELISDDKQIEILARSPIEFVSVLSEKNDEIIYNLPIGSEKLTLGVDTYAAGTYIIRLDIEGSASPVLAKLIKEDK